VAHHFIFLWHLKAKIIGFGLQLVLSRVPHLFAVSAKGARPSPRSSADRRRRRTSLAAWRVPSLRFFFCWYL
jgi:hypothetical protein